MLPVAAQKHESSYLSDLILPMQLTMHNQIDHIITECGEGEHLNSEAGDTGAPSVERLSLIVEMNHHGSLTSLHDSSCRDTPALELRPHGSASKDLLWSALEVKHNTASNPQQNHKNSVGMRHNLFCTFTIHISMSSLCKVHNGDVMPILLHDLSPNLLKIF